MTSSPEKFDAILFDLLTAVLDSWTLWNAVAGDADAGRRWREEYLRLTYAAGRYRPYESLVAEAAAQQGLDPTLTETLIDGWHDLRPWPEVPAVLRRLATTTRIGVVTNCSETLGRLAAAQVGVPFEVIMTAEAAGAYKPRPEPSERALAALELPPARVLFVAGSPFDIPGATGVGMKVWWHNRMRISRDHTIAPSAEHDSLTPLPDYLEHHAPLTNGSVVSRLPDDPNL